MPWLLVAALLVLPLLLALPADARTPAPPLQPDAAFALEVAGAGDGGLSLTWRIAEGYYLYRSSFEAADSAGQPLDLALPEGEAYADPWFGEGQIYRGTVTARLAAPVDGMSLHWQGCQQDGICYAPQAVRLAADGTILADAGPATGWTPQAGGGDDGANANASIGIGTGTGTANAAGLRLAPDQGLVAGLAARGGGLLVVAGFLGFGLLLAFTPCVFPMFPILAGMLAAQGERLTARRGLLLSGSYVLAMAAAFGLLGIAAAWSGANLQMLLQSPAATAIVAALFVALALSMFGLYELRMPDAVQRRLGRARGRRGSVGGAAALGFTSALILGPCVTAPLAGALLYIAQSGDLVLGAAALFALGLGQGLPLLAIGLFGPRILPRGGAWMEGARRAFGVVFLGFAIWLAARILPGPAILALWAALLVGVAVFLGALDRLDAGAGAARRLGAALGILLLLAGLVQGLGAALGGADPLRPLAPLAARNPGTGPGPEPGPQAAQFARVTDRAGLVQALATGSDRAALIYVTADWCVTCRAIERGPLADPAVLAALGPMATVAVDVSQVDAGSRALMQDLAAAGPPTMIFLDAGRAEAQGSRLIGQIDSAALLASIGKVSP